MIGQTIHELEAFMPGTYKRQGVMYGDCGLYYSEAFRHALFTRDSIVFESLANVNLPEARHLWEERVAQIEQPQQSIRTGQHDWFLRLLCDMVTLKSNSLAMYTALQEIRRASYDDTGRMFQGIRPLGIRLAISIARSVLAEVEEDVREATRCTRTQDLTVQEREDILNGSLTVSPSTVARAEYGRIEGDDDPDSLNYTGR